MFYTHTYMCKIHKDNEDINRVRHANKEYVALLGAWFLVKSVVVLDRIEL